MIILYVLHVHFICWYFFFYLNSHRMEEKKKRIFFFTLEILAANYNVIITKILITRVNSRFRTINFIFNTVLRLDDLALFNSALQLLIIFLFSRKFIREINIIYRI